ncbi:hypothetical protein GH714_042693 [Hevea brasiliensis]|uniref:Uncharacterized protein n=1 Tax=Hevea brasiliensis TaxID=3981 RepID=A0A6A6K399_HEVBR|nr:hypothetical protein GH714_042693 [Hevea brasiliensis]
MSAGDERSFEYKSQYQIALKLIMPAFGAVPRLLTSAQHEFSISHSGKSRDLFLTTRVSTNSRTNIIKLVATSATFKSYRKAFFYIYTESVIHAMVKHMNVIMRREFAHLDQQSLTVCAALDMYANQNYMSMMRAITDFFLRDPLGIAVYSDTALCIKYIGELIRFYTSSGDYPAYHALFWKLVVQEVWVVADVGPPEPQDSPGTRLAHYLALATVASPRLHKGIKALDIQHERWKKLLRTAEHTLKLYQLDAEASAIKALKRPKTTATTQYTGPRLRAASVGTCIRQCRSHSGQTHPYKRRRTIPYAVFVSHLQDVYLRVEGKYYSQNIIPKLLHHWADIRTRNPNMVNRPACEDAQAVIRLLEAKVSTTRLHTLDDAPSSSLPGTRLASCTTSYPFSGRTLERIGDAALTGFLSVVSVSPAMRELSLLQPECSIHLDVARAIT